MYKGPIAYCQIDITRNCNLRCSYCRQSLEKDLPDIMDMETFEGLFAQLHHAGCQRVSLAGGEPLIHRNFFNILRMAKAMIGEVSVLTNGTLLSTENCRAMKGYADNLQVSLDAFDPLVHDKIRGRRGCWEMTVAGIENAVMAGLTTGVRITISKENAHEAKDLMCYAHSLGASSFMVRRVVSTGKGVDTEKLDAQQMKAVHEELVEGAKMLNFKISFGDPFPTLLLNEDKQKAAREDKSLIDGKCIGGCSVGVDSMYIAQNGAVLLCPYFPVECGNIFTNTIADIWQDAQAYHVMRSIRHNLTGKCGACEFKFTCGGCRANAYYESGGDICASDNGCWK